MLTLIMYLNEKIWSKPCHLQEGSGPELHDSSTSHHKVQKNMQHCGMILLGCFVACFSSSDQID
jgi:hypothetical protein